MLSMINRVTSVTPGGGAVPVGLILRNIVSNLGAAQTVLGTLRTRFVVIGTAVSVLIGAVIGLIGITFGRDQIRKARDQMQQVIDDLGEIPTEADNAAAALIRNRDETARAVTNLQEGLNVIRREAC